MRTITIDWFRHGEPLGGRVFRGSTDDPLSENGKKQMRKAYSTFIQIPYDYLVSSPLKRCSCFADDLSKGMQKKLIIENRFKEMHFGDWEGRSSEAIWKTESEKLTLFWENPEENHPPNGEDFKNFSSRVTEAFHELIDYSNSFHALVICHGGVIRKIIQTVCDIKIKDTLSLDIPYASVTRIRLQYMKNNELPQYNLLCSGMHLDEFDLNL